MEIVRLQSRDVTLVGDRIPHRDAALVILAHGGGQTRHSWRGAAKKFAALGFETISVDLRGHGESGWAQPGRYRARDFADDLKAFAAEFGKGRRVALVGASLGGLAALLAAGDPDVTIDLVVMVDVVPRIAERGAARIRGFMERYPDGFGSLAEAAAAVAEYRGRAAASASGLERNLREGPGGRLLWHWDPAFLANRDPWPERIAQFEAAACNYRGPLLLVRGLQSDVVSDEGVAALRAVAPQLEETNVAHAGHMVVGDRNDVFVDGVGDFLARNFGVAA